jgi:hypothetical protein
MLDLEGFYYWKADGIDLLNIFVNPENEKTRIFPGLVEIRGIEPLTL